MSAEADRLLERIRSREARVGVVGLGYVGLPLAVEFARSGLDVTGIDLDAAKIDAIGRGESYIPDVRSADVAELVGAGRLRATSDFSCVAKLDTINICVPTPLRKTKDPDMAFVVAAVESISKHLHPGMLVILESTTYPGTTEELLQPLLEAGGLKAGRDFFLAFSPERVDPGNEKFNTRNVPKVVGGLSPQCSALARELYLTSLETVVPVTSPRVAEMVKLLENTFRAVNIGLVNEIALMCDKLEIDVWEVIDAARTKPFGFMPFYPGPGLGGHCIPIDPYYLSWKARQSGFEARFIELAGAINGSMPHYVLSLVAEALNRIQRPINGSRILVAGVSYKRNVDDIRESPALDLLGLLKSRGAEVAYSDPHVRTLSGRLWADGVDLAHVDPAAMAPGAYDCVVVVTEHAAFDYEQLQRIGKTVVDTRNAIRKPQPHVVRLGAPSVASDRAEGLSGELVGVKA
jgi:UDP-N-acetyl-D-glucosamine dehydrogenase